VDLCVDIGNTNLKWARYENGLLGSVHSLRHDSGEAQGLEAAWGGLPRPERIRVANVAGVAAQRMLIATTQRLWQLPPRFAQPRQRAYGVSIAYEEPRRLGVDRWLALVAIQNAGMTPALVLDCGTAVTLDAIDGSGNHLGGLIVPGLRMMWGSLFAGTRIPVMPFKEHRAMLGRDTDECIAGGALQAIVGMAERVRHRLNSGHDMQPQIVLTGSDARRIGDQLEFAHRYEPDLVLQGLTLLKG
jgi:type III pantothenate kinase